MIKWIDLSPFRLHKMNANIAVGKRIFFIKKIKIKIGKTPFMASTRWSSWQLLAVQYLIMPSYIYSMFKKHQVSDDEVHAPFSTILVAWDMECSRWKKSIQTLETASFARAQIGNGPGWFKLHVTWSCRATVTPRQGFTWGQRRVARNGPFEPVTFLVRPPGAGNPWAEKRTPTLTLPLSAGPDPWLIWTAQPWSHIHKS